MKPGLTYRFLLVLVFAGVFVSCAQKRYYTPSDPHWKDADTETITEPPGRDPSLSWDYVERTFFDQVEEGIDGVRTWGKITGDRKQSYNINSFDEVPNSSWFTNRHGLFDMSTEELVDGEMITGGPDTSGIWIMSRPKVGGVTPGFWIKDARGDMYIIKFDPDGFPDLATGANTIAARFFHAVGYNVPQETIVHWHPENLRIKEGLTFTDRQGVKRPFTQSDLEDILSRVERQPDGTIRSLASLLLKNVKGPFSFDGRRKDDPNDWCPHQHRRELRALYVFCSFVNHWDIKDQNTMDTWVETGGGGYLKHHLLDFGSTLGSAGTGPQDSHSGYANQVDLLDAFVSLFTLGLKKWQWEDAKPWTNPSVGYFESEIFHPAKWDPIYPIPSMENMTDRDAYWAAKIVMAFRDDDIRALVSTGEYRDKGAEDYLVKTLIERRDKIGRHWFGKVNPLDRFAFAESGEEYNITFEDLAVKYGLEQASESQYRFDIRYRGKSIIKDRDLGISTSLTLSSADLENLASRYEASDEGKPENHSYELRIRTRRGDGKWSKPTAIWLWYHQDRNDFQVVGIEHLD